MINQTAADAVARAWHPIGCKYADRPFETCQYRSQHSHTGRMVLRELAAAGWDLHRRLNDAQQLPLFGQKP